MNNLGERVKIKREELNLTQEEVSKLTNISRSNIGKIENNQIIPNSNAILELANLFSVTTDWLLKGEDNIELANDNNSCNEIDTTIGKRNISPKLTIKIAKLNENDLVYLENFLDFLIFKNDKNNI